MKSNRRQYWTTSTYVLYTIILALLVGNWFVFKAILRLGEGEATSTTSRIARTPKQSGKGLFKDKRKFIGADNIEFVGKVRRDAKTSIVDAPVETFNSVAELLGSLERDSAIRGHPLIGSAPDNARIEEEKRNVRVRAFLFAAKKSPDNDYHAMITDDYDQPTPEMTMTVEISGLPLEGPYRDRLEAVRSSFESHMESVDAYEVEGTDYEFYDSILVWIEGSLFFDIHHPSETVGPKGFRSSSVWEIHPVTAIDFVVP